MGTSGRVKCCSRCGEVKSIAFFHHWNQGHDGHRPECVYCRGVKQPLSAKDRERLRLLIEENKKLEPLGKRRCSSCRGVKDLVMFNKRLSGRQSRCRSCASGIKDSLWGAAARLRHLLLEKGLRLCRLCGKAKAFASFDAVSSLLGTCSECRPKAERQNNLTA